MTKTSEKISITRALVQLKLLDKKINDRIKKSSFASVTVNGEVKCKDFTPKEDFQAVNDLITQRAKIKSAIMVSNTNTKVKIGEEILSVLDCIELKNSIVYKTMFANKMTKDYNDVIGAIEDINEQVKRQTDKLIETSLGREAKHSDADTKAIVEPYEKRNKASLTEVKNFDILKEREKLANYIEEFQAEVDLVLSESNAKTLIEI